MIRTVNTLVGISVLAFMILMVVAALIDMRRGGSLDDLPADVIDKAVNG